MNPNKTQLQSGDISIIGILLILPGFIIVFLFILFSVAIDRREVVEDAAAPAQEQLILSEQAALIATINAVPPRTPIPRDITSNSSQAVANAMGYSESMINNGQRDFLAVCSACHGTDARGISGVGKPLLNSEFVRSRSDQDLLNFIILGRQPWDPANTTGVAMPARGGQGMTDQTLINVIAYVRVLDGHSPDDTVVAVPSDGSAASSNTTTDQTDSPPIDDDHVSIVAIDLLSGGDETTDVVEADTGRDSATLYPALCEADEASQSMCNFLVEQISGGADQARIADLLTNGSSPFDTSIPAGIFIPQRGGQLALTDTEIQNLTSHLFSLAGIETDTDESTGDSEATDRDSLTLYPALCEADEVSQSMCDFLIEQITGGADQARITDLLTNGSSPFDTSIPADIFIPQRGGQLFLTDTEIQTVTVHLFGLAGVEIAADEVVSEPSSRDGATLYAALCEADDTSQMMCDYLLTLINDGTERDHIDDLLTNGSSPFDTSIPEGIFIPQRGGSLLFTNDEVQILVEHFFTLTGEEVGRLPQETSPAPNTTIQTVAYSEPDGPTLYADLCEYTTDYQVMCNYLVGLIADGASRDRIEYLLTNGGSTTDLTIPDDIFIPKRGGYLILSDAEIQLLAAYLFSLANVELPDTIATIPTGTLYSTDSPSGMSYVSQLQGSVISPPRELDDFALPSTTGQDFTLSDYGGKIIMVYFGYLTCPDVCPATLADMRRAYLEVGEPYQDVVVLFITLDPERDTLDHLASYVNAFHTDFIGLRPTSLEQLETLKSNFGVFSETREVESGAGYLIDHSATVFLIAPDGRIISQFPFGVSYREITNDLNVLLNYTLSPSEVGAELTEERVPVNDPAREFRIVIPEGTSSQIALGNDPDIIPLTINLTLGERDVLVLENHDNSDFLVGGVWVAPYETVRKQFYEAQTFVGLCTVTVGRDLVEIVVVEPD
jgi:protein SCO1/2